MASQPAAVDAATDLVRPPAPHRKSRCSCEARASLSRFEAFTVALGVLPLDEPAARETGRLRALREAAGLASQPSDMMIAAIAAVAGAALATRSINDFGALPIELLNPWRGR